jgi:hypothetical protein
MSATKERTIQWSVGLTRDAAGVVLVTEKRGRKETTDAYIVSAVPTQLGGLAFSFRRITERDGETELPIYHILLGGDGVTTCECLGFLRYGRCRHLEAIAMRKT